MNNWPPGYPYPHLTPYNSGRYYTSTSHTSVNGRHNSNFFIDRHRNYVPLSSPVVNRSTPSHVNNSGLNNRTERPSSINNQIRSEILRQVKGHQVPGESSESSELRGKKRHSETSQSDQAKRVCSETVVEDVPVGPRGTDEYAEISVYIQKYFHQKKQSQGIYRSKVNLRDALYSIVQGIFPYCGLYIVGSSMNGFGNNSSDMDMCLMLTKSNIDQRKEALEVLRMILKSFRACSFVKRLLLIKAKVPILKFYDAKSGVECDLNINNQVGIRNTHLLKMYSRMDWRVVPLVLFVKYWAKTHDINDASKATISSYSLTLLVLHFLQVTSPPVLPSLQQKFPGKFDKKLDISCLKLEDPIPEWTTHNNSSLGELFVGFLNYYTNSFDFSTSAISVRTSSKFPINYVRNQTSNSDQWKFICIEEPFDLSNTARSVYNEHTFMRILRVFRTSYRTICKTRDPISVVSHPF